jgi:hypothetical protein
MRSFKRRQSDRELPCWNSRLTGALWALEDGVEAEALRTQLVACYGCRYGRRIVDIASTRLWIAEGFSVGDLQTILEAAAGARFRLSNARHVIGVPLMVRQAMAAEPSQFISNRKETRHAAA